MTIPIAKIGVIGAGQMGSGIAQVCAVAGYQVQINDPFDATGTTLSNTATGAPPPGGISNAWRCC